MSNASQAAVVRPYREVDEKTVITLWSRCGLLRLRNDPRKDIARKIAVSPNLFLVAVVAWEPVGTVMAGYEGHRGWINYLAVPPSHRRQGIGRLLMAESERLHRAAGCPNVNLQVRSENTEVLTFYRRLGYAVDDVLSLGKRIVEDNCDQ
ncbi:MAG: GNAT family acetyltransferase [Planctomycetaceae bacterium]|nr:GNAT family acetyltransferase [Planctomycetaceae bacterium]